MISREEIFNQSFIRKVPIQVTFLPNSTSFQKYGSQLIIEGIFTQEEAELLLVNYYSETKIITQGLVKAKELINNIAKNSNELAEVGIDTNDIFEIAYR